MTLSRSYQSTNARSMQIHDGVGPPDPLTCQTDSDAGRLYRDTSTGTWYECFFDSRRKTYTWAILPPGDDDPSD